MVASWKIASRVKLNDDRRERKKRRGSVVWMIIKMDLKAVVDDEFIRCGSSRRKERIKFIQKTEKGLEKVEDKGR